MLVVNFSPFPEITTDRLFLRQVHNDDTDAIFNLRSNSSVMKYIDRRRAVTVQDALDVMKLMSDLLEKNEGITWAITLKDDPSRLIGTIGYWRFNKENYRAEIGYMLSADFWKQGIMKEAIYAVIPYAFNTLGLHSIEADIHPDNTASATLLGSTGFVKEAHFKENYFFEGVFKDTIIYSRLNNK